MMISAISGSGCSRASPRLRSLRPVMSSIATLLGIERVGTAVMGPLLAGDRSGKVDRSRDQAGDLLGRGLADGLVGDLRAAAHDHDPVADREDVRSDPAPPRPDGR